MGLNNDTIYTHGGELNGKGLHKWHCLSCPWTQTALGGSKEQNVGQRKAEAHRCYDSSKDAQARRRDIYG
jgi:hypothetical protein